MNRAIKISYGSLIYLFLYLPIAILIIYSFNNAPFSSIWHGATLKWYHQLFNDRVLMQVTGHSLLIATLAATISMVVGAISAIALFKYRFMGKNVIYSLLFVLIIIPDLVFGIALLVLYVMFKIPLGFWTLLLAHISFCLPFVMLTVYGRLHDMDKNLFEAAKDLGASESVIFMRVILPLIVPALLAGWLLSFTLSMDDVIISFFVTGPTFQILPLYIYSQVHIGITPEINALCTLIFAATVLAVVLVQLLMRKKR